jgi:voltage-gated potassium channel
VRNGRWRQSSGSTETLTTQPGHQLVGILRIPESRVSPVRAISRRVAIALAALFAAVVTVYLDLGGYRDVLGGSLTFVDCLYYPTVSLSTGYGDITPYIQAARLVNILVITPLRIAFLIVLVSTTLEVLTERSRQAWKIQRWRNKVHNHTVVVGYGTKGKSAVVAMLCDKKTQREIVVVDTDRTALDHAAAAGLVTVHGDATKIGAPEVDAIEATDRLLYIRNAGH